MARALPDQQHVRQALPERRRLGLPGGERRERRRGPSTPDSPPTSAVAMRSAVEYRPTATGPRNSPAEKRSTCITTKPMTWLPTRCRPNPTMSASAAGSTARRGAAG